MANDEPISSKERLTYAALAAAVLLAIAMLYVGGIEGLKIETVVSLLAAFGFGVALPSPLAK